MHLEIFASRNAFLERVNRCNLHHIKMGMLPYQGRVRGQHQQSKVTIAKTSYPGQSSLGKSAE